MAKREQESIVVEPNGIIFDLDRHSILEGQGNPNMSSETADGTDGLDDVSIKGMPNGRIRKLLLKDPNAPKAPSSGYTFFMAYQREILRETNPGLAFHEVSKLISQKWAQLDTDAKSKYLEAAEADKERYQTELEEYQQTDSYKTFMDQLHQEDDPLPSKRRRKKVVYDDSDEDDPVQPEPSNFNAALGISIFTEEFLNYNKIREAEVRQLRKANSEYDDQNDVIMRHLDTMRATVDKMESETSNQYSDPAVVHQLIESLRNTIAIAVNAITPPSQRSKRSKKTKYHAAFKNNQQVKEVSNLPAIFCGQFHAVSKAIKLVPEVVERIKTVAGCQSEGVVMTVESRFGTRSHVQADSKLPVTGPMILRLLSPPESLTPTAMLSFLRLGNDSKNALINDLKEAFTKTRELVSTSTMKQSVLSRLHPLDVKAIGDGIGIQGNNAFDDSAVATLLHELSPQDIETFRKVGTRILQEIVMTQIDDLTHGGSYLIYKCFYVMRKMVDPHTQDDYCKDCNLNVP